MDLTNIDDLKVALQLAGIKSNKGLGQHFLVDQDSLEAVMAAGELAAGDTVVEVGPGLGVMTVPLTRQVSQVIAIEMDHDLAELLERQRPDNLEIRRQDIMDLNVAELPKGYKVVANIPYYLTSAIIRLFLASDNPPRLLSLLVQKEVAQRVVAQPGQMSILALSVQYYAEVRLVAVVERHKFWPPPKVDSAVLQIRVRAKPAFAADVPKLFRLIKAGFGEKRKMLRNSLAGGLNISTELAADLILRANLPETARAQELSLDSWKRLYNEAIKRRYLG
jgi:16S rRNA (adenine1518-N6/adenine1519-N6)-dimethyltransferase